MRLVRRWVWLIGAVACSTDPEQRPIDEPASPEDPVAVPTGCEQDRPGVFVDGKYHSEYLQTALDAADEGSTVEVCAAAYLGPFVAPRPVQLEGIGGSAVTILESLTGGTVLTLQPGSTVAGFTVRGGDAAAGGGLLLEGPGGFTVDGCTIEGNAAELGGGIAIAGGATVSILGSTVTGNVADLGGGISVGPGSSADLVLTVIRDNVAVTAGGGVALDGGSLFGGEVLDNQVSDATVADPPVDGGGGISATGSVTVDGTSVTGNRAANAPGILVRGGSLTLRDAAVTHNSGLPDSRSLGGGLACVDAVVTLFGTELYENQAADGGGLWAHGCTLTGGTVASNVATDDGGGVVLFASTLFQATVSDNVAGRYPSGVWLAGSSALVESWVERHGGEWGAVEAGPESRMVGTSIVDSSTCAVLVSGQLTMERSQVLRNTQGACVLGGFNPSAALDSVESDWGVDADDNAVDLSWGETYTGYGSNETFSCSDGCDPMP